MKKVCTFISLMAVCISLFAWDSPIALPNLGDASIRVVSQNARNYLQNFSASNADSKTYEDFEAKTELMANSTMAKQITGAYAYNINNGDFTDSWKYNYSDHDAVYHAQRQDV